jgi:predicted amidohydrolase YtcJ
VATPAPADLILHHGKVLTVDRAFSVKSAVAIETGAFWPPAARIC